MIWQVLKRLEQVIDSSRPAVRQDYSVLGWPIKNFMSFVFDQQDQGYINFQNIKKQIFRELFLGRDLESVDASLENIFAKIEQKS
jgi:hypothetical protein